MKNFLGFFFPALLLVGCNSLPAATALPSPQHPTSTSATIPPTWTSIPVSVTMSVMPTPTEWLPYNPNYSAEGCDEFTATLPVNDAKNLSQLEISRRLFEIYLKHFQSPGLGGLCRLEDFKVENVLEDPRLNFLAAEQGVAFVNTVAYSLQVKEAPTQWAAGNGELATDGWIVHKGLIIGVTKVNDEYILKLIGTGP